MYAMYSTRRALIIMMALVIVLGMVPMFVSATTYTDQVELETDSVILVDRSGSVKDRERVEEILDKINPQGEIAEVPFDSGRLALGEYAGGGNSPICEAIDAAAAGGFTHITVVTDGEQWPQDYSALGIYTDLDIKIVLTEDALDAESEALVRELQDHLVNSSLEVNFPSGEIKVFMDGYQPPLYTVEIEVPDPTVSAGAEDGAAGADGADGADAEGDQAVVYCNHECTHKCRWWCIWALPVALLALLLALLSLLLWLLGRKSRGWRAPVVRRLKQGACLLLDFSGSMAAYIQALLDIARQAKAKFLIGFADFVRRLTLQEAQALACGGCTYGVEALQMAYDNGEKVIIIASDMGFNGKELSDFHGEFEEILILAPDANDSHVLTMAQALRQYAKRVEVLPLA